MLVSFFFIVVEWCTQSHLSTENYEDAMKGLKRTRRFKKYTAWLRDVPDLVIELAKRLWLLLLGRHTQPGAHARRSLTWKWQTKNHDNLLPVIEAEIPGDQEKAIEAHVEEILEGQGQMVHARVEAEESLTEALPPRDPDLVEHHDHEITVVSGKS